MLIQKPALNTVIHAAEVRQLLKKQKSKIWRLRLRRDNGMYMQFVLFSSIGSVQLLRNLAVGGGGGVINWMTSFVTDVINVAKGYVTYR